MNVAFQHGDSGGMVVCTIAAENYVHKALYMAQTLRRHHADVQVVLCVPERVLNSHLHADDRFDQVLLARDLGLPGFEALAFTRSVVECSTAIKPGLLLWLLRHYPDHEKFIYLDPDMEICGPLVEASDALDRSDIVATPHHLADAHARFLVATLRTGVFNLGFLGIRRSGVTLEFLKWWAERLREFGYVDLARGLFVDQKWMDLATTLFPVQILRHPGYNVAYWNVAERPLEEAGEDLRTLGEQVRLFHFARMDLGHDLPFLVSCQGARLMVARRARFRCETEKIRVRYELSQRWSYDYFDSGEPIARETRAGCRANTHLLESCADPFCLSNEYFGSRIRS